MTDHTKESLEQLDRIIQDAGAARQKVGRPGHEDRPEPVKQAIRAAMGLCAAMMKAMHDFLDFIDRPKE